MNREKPKRNTEFKIGDWVTALVDETFPDPDVLAGETGQFRQLSTRGHLWVYAAAQRPGLFRRHQLRHATDAEILAAKLKGQI